MYKIARKNVSNMFKLDDLLEYLRRDNRYDIFFVSNNFIREKKKKKRKKKRKEKKRGKQRGVYNLNRKIIYYVEAALP